VSVGTKPTTCVASVGISSLDWSGLTGTNHFSGVYLATPVYNTPFSSLSTNMAPAVDVTSVVKTWFKHPEINHGLILSPVKPPLPYLFGQGECFSWLGNFVLEIEYFAP
jgi:hypothetical protein